MHRTLVLLLMMMVPLAASAEAVIVYVEGLVSVIDSNGTEFEAFIGDTVAQDEFVGTGADGYAVIELNDATTIKLQGNTTVSMDSLSTSAAVTVSDGGVLAQLRARAGSLAGRSMEIRAAAVVAAVRGTEFMVGIAPRGTTEGRDVWVLVNEGAVAVEQEETGDSTTVEAGLAVNVARGSEMTEPRYYEWTERLNWNFDPDAGETRDQIEIRDLYIDLLNEDYD